MKSLRAILAVAALSGASLAAGFLGFSVLQNVQFAQAQQTVEATRQQLAAVNDLSDVFRQVGKVVGPSVVKINITKTIKGVRPHFPFDDRMFRRFFPDQNGEGDEDLPGNANPNDNDEGETLEQIGTGSGVIMDVVGSDAYILTNNHVAGGATEMDVTPADGRLIKNASLVGADPKTDLAVIKIQTDRVVAAKWGNSDALEQGDWVLAFGSPFGYVGSMTHGIVSALHRDQMDIIPSGYENFIQVDAPINPGNSGGPLVNIRGEVIGINTAIASRSGGFQGIGFAIPSNLARTIYTSLKTSGKVVRGWLGVGIASVSEPEVQPIVRNRFGYEGKDGVLVQEVIPDTPASGKLRNGDIVTKVNGKLVKDAQDLRNAIAAIAPGSEIALAVFRDGKTQDVTMKVGSQPENLAAVERSGRESAGQPGAPASSAALGLHLATPTADQLQRLGLTTGQGALVTRVEPRSPAAHAGLRPGDLITSVDKQDVSTAQQARDALNKADLKKGITLYVIGRESSRYVFIQTDGR